MLGGCLAIYLCIEIGFPAFSPPCFFLYLSLSRKLPFLFFLSSLRISFFSGLNFRVVFFFACSLFMFFFFFFGLDFVYLFFVLIVDIRLCTRRSLRVGGGGSMMSFSLF